MRKDSKGLFWTDEVSKPQLRQLVLPPIPKTTWRPPSDYPNLSSAKIIGVDIETYEPNLADFGPGWARGEGYICGVSITADEDFVRYYPMRHTVQNEWNLDVDNTMSWLKDVLTTDIPKVGANLLYDYSWLRVQGITLGGKLYDVQVAETLIDDSAKVNLEALGQKYIGEGKDSADLYEWCAQAYGGLKTAVQRGNIYRAPLSLVGTYAEQDALLPVQVLKKQYPLLQEFGLLELFDMEMRLLPLLYEMRKKGVRVDVEQAELLYSKLSSAQDEELEELNRVTGFNITSIKQNSALIPMLEKIGIVLPLTPTGLKSVTTPFLEGCNHPVARKIVEIRHMNTINETFVKNFVLGTNVNGRIHCQFHPVKSSNNLGMGKGTISGRFSSSTPNLQQIPKRSKLGKEIRTLFLPDEWEQWRRYDYNQVEYRMLIEHAVGQGAYEAKQLYIENPKTDFHTMTQRLILKHMGFELDRSFTKTVNFGLTYGMGKNTVMATLQRFDSGLKEEKVEKLLTAYHQSVPFSRATLNYYMDIAQKVGYVKTIMGRITRFDKWEKKYGETPFALDYEQALSQYGYNIKRAKTYKALNAVLQGSAADLMKMAMLRAYEEGIFAKVGIPMLTVHDELDFSDAGASEKDWGELQWMLENAIKLSTPFLAEPEVGPNWGDSEPLEVI